MSRPGEGQEGGREHSPSSLTPVTVREPERSYPRRGYCFLPKGKYRAFTDFFPQREIFGSPPCFSFPAKVDEKGEKRPVFSSGILLRAAYFLRSCRNRSRGAPAGVEWYHCPICPHLSGTPSEKKTTGSMAALLSASHRTGSRASTPVPGNLPMKREGRRTNLSVCPPAITPFPPVIPGTSPPQQEPIPPERTGAASVAARRSAVPGWICSTERVAVSLNSCLTKQKITVLYGKFRITGKRPAYSCRFLSFCCNLAATLAISWRSASVIPVDTCTSSAGLSPAESRTKTAALVFPAMACATCASVIAS